MVPNVGFELTTYRLQGGCSTTELIRHYVVSLRRHCERLEIAWQSHAVMARRISRDCRGIVDASQ